MTERENDIRDKILKGLELTHKKLIQMKKDRNQDLVISVKGKVVHINANELQNEIKM